MGLIMWCQNFGRDIFGGKYLKGGSLDNDNVSPTLHAFSLPAPIPQWPQGGSFAMERITLGDMEVAEITSFEFLWGSHLSHDKSGGVSFYKPVGIPEGFFSLGHYCQLTSSPLNGYILVAKALGCPEQCSGNDSVDNRAPPLVMPVDYLLIWVSDDGMGIYDQPGYFWLPQAPSGYKALGFIVTNQPEKPSLNEVRCVREDLTDKCERRGILLDMQSKFRKIPFKVWKTRPCHRGMHGRGVSVGTFFCSCEEDVQIACLKNLDPGWNAMPNLDQIHALIHHYGPTLFFHPKEVYLPSSVSWFFKNGALLIKSGVPVGEPIDEEGSNMPGGGSNDGKFWVDLPCDNRREMVKRGNIASAELYVHVKPALGGTFTDIAMWVFSPFNGPATLKLGPTNISMSKVGEHIGDWEHFSLRISNFTGILHSIYFSQHSGGEWINACDLEFIEGNRAIVYSSKGGHASFPHPGTYLQGSAKLGIGIRNDCARSNLSVDSSERYKIVSAEYLGGNVLEPCWLHFMREWGPKIVYNSRTELDKIIKRLPIMVRGSVANFFKKFPVELFGEEGPTGPKEKNNWVGDERW